VSVAVGVSVKFSAINNACCVNNLSLILTNKIKEIINAIIITNIII
jgi:hypothetical protein